MRHDFCYISKHDPSVKQEYKNLVKLLNETQHALWRDFSFRYEIVGSYKRNMITYDAKSNVGYDFDFDIEVFDDYKLSPKEIKLKFMNGLRKTVKNFGYDYPEDSTKVITIKKKDRKNSKVILSCDLCIVNNYDEDGDPHTQYIHHIKNQCSYEWKERSDGHHALEYKVKWLKSEKCWHDVRERYIELKNTNDDPNLKSRALQAIAVNEICQRYGYDDE